MNNRLLELLKQAPEDIRSLTVEELIDRLQVEVNAQKKERDDADKAICEKFNGTYIKFSDPDGLFGEEMTYMSIESIKPGTYTTDWERVFFIEGTRIFFSNGFTGARPIKPSDAGDSMEEYRLNDATIITKKEFDEALAQCEQVNSLIDKMRK